ncbi:MAG: hypothetical protein ABW121_20795 [Candidatus Thiodiazotropha sp. 6PLUC7]
MLPESKRKTAEKLSDIAIDLVKASTTDNNDKYKNCVAQKISDVTLLDYQAASYPFLPPINKTQLMCHNEYIFAYREGQYKTNDKITYVINNKSYNSYPGTSGSHEKDNEILEILYLEYDKENSFIKKVTI